MKKLLFLLSLSSQLSIAQQDVNRTVPPIRPTFQDVSLKAISDTYPSYAYKWYRGHTATQSEKDAMEETLSGIAIPEAARYAKSISACAGAAKKAIGQWNGITSKLGIGYEDNSLKGNHSWNIPTQGRHYSFERYGLLAIRGCSLGGTGKTQCGQSPLMTKDMQDLLNLKIVNGVCVAGADFIVPLPTEAYDIKRANVDTVVSKVLRPKLTAAQMSALHATHSAHKLVSDWRCGSGQAPTLGAVDREHQAFESLARDITEQHFFAMKRFSGAVDPQWTKAEECKWARLQDKGHEAWMNAVMLGDWRKSRLAENDHQMSHQCMNLKDVNYNVLFSCGADNVFECPKMTCAEYLAKL